MSILAEILAVKAGEVAHARAARPPAVLHAALAEVTPPRGFGAALARPAGAPVRIIAEIKRASPSAGPIRAGADPAEIAREYAEAGASCLSVLTDERYFDGHLSFLGRARDAVAVPLLRKDFVIDPYQVLEARAAGADAVLLIVAGLEQSLLSELHAAVVSLGMDALVEIHSEAEAERALAAGARIIGVNHRNLATFEIDMSLTGRLRPHVPDGTVLVGESGIRTHADLDRLGAAGADAILVGESLMRAPSPGQALRELCGA
ncbi:MAG TPA: indole-3-glycerol phosphate synthase TrpC [Kofleriaceae bacterium]|nr:indole-3-glycerol phosphate synthase TrpC [Kofleriaceae bacterium]